MIREGKRKIRKREKKEKKKKRNMSGILYGQKRVRKDTAIKRHSCNANAATTHDTKRLLDTPYSSSRSACLAPVLLLST
jgi:hypothetical protein